MTENTLRTAIDDDEPSIGTRIVSYWPGMMELLGQTEVYDYVEFLAEYAPWDLHDLDNLARAAELADLSTMIKVDGHNRSFIAQRAMAAGFQNLLFADIKTVEDAEEAVNAVRAEPSGENGVRMDRRNGYVGGYASPGEVAERSDDAVLAIMVEKRETLENLEDILSIGEIDMVQFGPADYSLSLGRPDEIGGEDVADAYRQTIATALDMDVAPRAEINHPKGAQEYLDQGVKHFNLNTDVRILHNWWQEQGATLEQLVR